MWPGLPWGIFATVLRYFRVDIVYCSFRLRCVAQSHGLVKIVGLVPEHTALHMCSFTSAQA